MKPTVNDIHEYLEQWYSHDEWTDFNMAWDSGYTKYAAYLISSGGAFDNEHYDNKEIEVIKTAIKKMLDKYSARQRAKDLKACFSNAEVWIHPDTNEHAFIRNGDVDYLVTTNDMYSYGYVTAKEYYENIEAYEYDKQTIANTEPQDGGY